MSEIAEAKPITLDAIFARFFSVVLLTLDLIDFFAWLVYFSKKNVKKLIGKLF